MRKIKFLLICILSLVLLTPTLIFAEQEKPSTTYNFYIKNAVNTSGQYIEQIKVGTSKISEGTSGSKAEKWFINFMTGKLLYEGTYQNVQYTFDGQFLDENNNPITFPIVTEYIENIPTVDIYLYPHYNLTPLSFLHFNYIDNISTGSGSWANEDSATSYTHTFSQPDEQEGYKFIRWENLETGQVYLPEDTYFCDISSLEPGETKEVNIYAIWQPSLIVNWYDNGQLLNTQESFNEDILAYSFNPLEKEGMDFVGWVDEDGNTIDKETVYSIPTETTEKVEPNVINLYTVYEEIPDPEPTEEPTPEPTKEPEPDPEPTDEPTPEPTTEPQPTDKPTPEPEPTTDPEPTDKPTPKPTETITPEPTEKPIIKPTDIPQQTDNSTVKVPETGDNNNINALFLIMLIAICTIIAIILIRKRETV